jgi:MFS family permease
MKINILPHRFGARPEKWPFFYGWFVLFAGALGMLVSLPGQTIGMSVFIDPLMTVLGTGRSRVSFAFMVGTLGAALVLPAMGRLYDRRGAPFMAVLSGAALGLVLLYMASIDIFARLAAKVTFFSRHNLDSLIVLSFGFLFLRLWGQGVLAMVSRTMVMKWFDRRRGFANGIFGFIITIGMALSPRVFDFLISAFSWRGAYAVLAALVGVAFPLGALLFFRDNPFDYGLRPDGDSPGGISPHGSVPSAEHPFSAYTLKEARGTSLFRYFTAVMFLSAVIDVAFTFHIISIFDKAGMDRASAVRFFFPAYLLGLGSHFIGSWLSDYIESKYFAVLQLFGVFITCGAMLVLSSGISFWVLVVGQALCHGMYGIAAAVILPRYYGTTHLGALTGFAMAGMVIGSALGPFLFSLSLDTFGDYFIPAISGLVATGVLMVLMVRSFRKS